MSNEPKHTATPWIVNKIVQWSIEDNDRNPIADCGDYQDQYPNGIANAARIVQCVNACEGLDDPEKWIKQQKEYRTEMSNSTLSAEVDKRIAIQSELESLRAANAELQSRFENEARDLGVAEHEIEQLKSANAELVEALRNAWSALKEADRRFSIKTGNSLTESINTTLAKYETK